MLNMSKSHPVIALTQEEAERQGALVRAQKAKDKRTRGLRVPVSSPVSGEDWGYIIKRVEGLSAYASVIALAEERGEVLNKQDAASMAVNMEKRLGRQVEAQIRGKVMSDEDFEAWTRMKVEQLVATPTPNSQGVIRAIQFLKKSREEGKARNPVALMRQVHECASRIHELDVLEAKAVERGLKDAPTDGEHGSQ